MSEYTREEWNECDILNGWPPHAPECRQYKPEWDQPAIELVMARGSLSEQQARDKWGEIGVVERNWLRVSAGMKLAASSPVSAAPSGEEQKPPESHREKAVQWIREQRKKCWCQNCGRYHSNEEIAPSPVSAVPDEIERLAQWCRQQAKQRQSEAGGTTLFQAQMESVAAALRSLRNERDTLRQDLADMTKVCNYWQYEVCEPLRSRLAAAGQERDALKRAERCYCGRTADEYSEVLSCCKEWRSARSSIEELALENRSLRSQLAQARADSERLDWLEKNEAHIVTSDDNEGRVQFDVGWMGAAESYFSGGYEHNLREAIDAARNTPTPDSAFLVQPGEANNG